MIRRNVRVDGEKARHDRRLKRVAGGRGAEQIPWAVSDLSDYLPRGHGTDGARDGSSRLRDLPFAGRR
jgi:hypothetical protein